MHRIYKKRKRRDPVESQRWGRQTSPATSDHLVFLNRNVTGKSESNLISGPFKVDVKVMTGSRETRDGEGSGREALGSLQDFVVAGGMEAWLFAVSASLIQASFPRLSAAFLFRISANCGSK